MMNIRHLSAFLAFWILVACSSSAIPISAKSSIPPASVGKANPTSHALLIGIGDYKASGLLPLEGPKNDIPLMQSLLTGRFGIPESNITVLQDRKATHTNIQKAFVQLAERVKQGDFVYIYYSGHGGIMPDGNGDEVSGEDQTWVSYGSREGRLAGLDDWDILDDELNEWLGAVYAKTDQVAFVSDSCHSGSVSRGPLTEVRFAQEDLRIHPLAKQPIKSTADVGIRIGAAQDDDYAYGTDQNSKSYGKFTWYWVEALNQVKPGETWQSVFTRTFTTMTADPRTHQQPQISGKDNRTVFGGQFVALKPGVPVTKVEADKKIVWLKGGSVSGVTKGSRYRIFDPAAPNRNDSPCMEINQVDSFDSQAKFDGCEIHLGDNALEVEHNYTTPPIRLQIKADFPNAQDKGIVEDLKKVIGELDGFQLVDEGSRADWAVYVLRPERKNGNYVYKKAQTLPNSVLTQPPEVWVVNPQGKILNERLRISLSDPEKGKEALKENLVNFARVQEFKGLSVEGAPVPVIVKVSYLRADPGCKADCIPIKGSDGVKQTYRKEAPTNFESLAKKPPRLGDILAFSAINESVDGDYFLYLLDITPEGGIKAIFPEPGDNDDTARVIMGKKDRDLRRVLKLDSSGTETLKIIASRKPIDVSLFEREDLREIKGARSSLNPLERLLLSTMDTRGDPVSIAVGDWSSTQVEFEVK